MAGAAHVAPRYIQQLQIRLVLLCVAATSVNLASDVSRVTMPVRAESRWATEACDSQATNFAVDGQLATQYLTSADLTDVDLLVQVSVLFKIAHLKGHNISGHLLG